MVVFDWDAKFTSKFSKTLFAGMGTQPNFITAYHPQIDRRIKRTNQILEDVLRMYVMEKPSKWEYFLHLGEFAYNSSYQASIKMNLCKALYGTKFHTTIS